MGIEHIVSRVLVFYVAYAIGLYSVQEYLIDNYRYLYVAGLYFFKFFLASVAIILFLLFVARARIIRSNRPFVDMLMLVMIIVSLPSLVYGIIGWLKYDYDFYYVAGDFLGWIQIPILYFSFVYFFRSGVLRREWVFGLFTIYLLAGALLSIGKLLLSQYGVITYKSIGLFSYVGYSYLLFLIFSRHICATRLCHFFEKYKFVIIAIILGGMAVSARRTTIVVSIIMLFLFLAFYVARNTSLRRKASAFILLLCMGGGAVLLAPHQAVNKISGTFTENSAVENAAIKYGSIDMSTATRLMEIEDIFRHVVKEANIFNYIFGFGAGAEYSADQMADVREESRIHHAHMVYPVVFFRAGAVGLFVMLAIFAYVGVRGLFSMSDQYSFVASVAILGLALDYFTAQNFYFSLEFPLLVAIFSVHPLVGQVVSVRDKQDCTMVEIERH